MGLEKKIEFDQKVKVGFLPLSVEKSFSSNFSNAKHLSRSTVVRDGGANPMFLFQLHNIFTFGNMALDKVP